MTRDEAIHYVAGHGWVVARVTKRGYFIMRVGSDLRITVEVTIDEDEELDALTLGLAAIKTAFQAAGVGAAGVVVPRDLRSRVLPLQAA